jgi:hypothetical protein
VTADRIRSAAWLGGISVLGVGMVLAVAGVLAGPLFLPGVVLLGAGFVLLAAAAVAGVAAAG